MASSYLPSHPEVSIGASTAVDSLVNYATNSYKTDIKQSNQLLGLGWSGDTAADQMDCKHWPVNVLGWIVTALAISLGAPFWFDLLGKLVQLRGTGTKPEETKSS